MKELVYKIINKLGYNIYRKNKKNPEILNRLKRYSVFENFELLYNCHHYIFVLEEKYKDFNVIDEDEKRLKVSFDGLQFIIESGEEFLILKEVFIDLEYNFKSLSNCIVFDIGANLGMTSVFFSRFSNVNKIFSFEPIKDNFEIASENFLLNDISKIELFNFGLGKSDHQEVFLYSRLLKGNSGKRWKNNINYHGQKNLEKREVEIKKASKTLLPIIQAEQNCTFVVKMDCEGAEYEIMENLAEENILGFISILMIEWHDHGPQEILNYLEAKNFTTFSRAINSISGMIYAVNKNPNKL